MKKLLLIFSTILSLLGAAESTKPNCCTGPVLCTLSPFQPQAGCCYDFSADIGILYQQPAATGFTAGFSYTPTFSELTQGGEFNNQVITELSECPSYALGVTAGLSLLATHDDWVLQGAVDWVRSYTEVNFRNDDNGTLTFRPTLGVSSNIFQNTDFDFDTEAFARIEFNGGMEVIQLNVSLKRGSYQTGYFGFEPYAGVKALWFRTEIISKYRGGGLNPSQSVVFGKQDNSFGAGPLFGFYSEYHFTKQFSLFSDSDLGVLYGRSHSYLTSAIDGLENEGRLYAQGNHVYHNSDCAFLFPVRSILGLQYSDYCYETHHVAFKIGYDVRLAINYPTHQPGYAMNGLYTDLKWSF